jgi:pimeloyl-ACP methyl ester carboxylesterase
MNRKRYFRLGIVLSAVALLVPTQANSQAMSGTSAISSRSAEVQGTKLHYLTAGHGPALILLHGYTQTSRMWRPIIPRLAAKFTVIAPDLTGIGDSDIPANGLDMKSAAATIHARVKSLGVTKACVVGHDIGLMVAYAYAAQFPTETEKLVEMDAFLPGVPG